nr:reverse transcriptase domain-containing protein [Tanacetum cinerariifolium]
MQKNLALITKYFKKLYKPTNNNLRTSSNSRDKNVDPTLNQVEHQNGIQCFNSKEFGHFTKECRKPKRVKDSMYHKEKMLMCKQVEKGVPLQAEQWLADTDEKIDEQELEALYNFMAKIQEVPTANSGTDTEPLEQVQYDVGYYVFANERQHSKQLESISNTCVVEKVDNNFSPDSLDMCDNDIQTDQNAVECDDEHVALANLIANLKVDVDENKKIQKQLKKAKTTLPHELIECKSILAKTSKTLRESNSIRDSCLIALQNKQTGFKRYTTLNDRTVDYEKPKHKLNETLGLLAQKEIDIKEGFKLKAYEILVVKEKHDELVIQSLLTKSHYEGLVKEKKRGVKDASKILAPLPGKQKQQEKDEIQIQKFWHMFKQLHLNITLVEALVLMPKYQKMLKALLSNKEKLQGLANIPLNENCSAVILKKLPEKLGDPGKFLIPCGFSELKCKALADLGASINLMPLSVWKKLGLPDLIPTRMTLELVNCAICTPDGTAKDVFISVGKFTFPADFVIVNYESDPRVPLILGRPFLRTARALIDVHGEEMILRDGDEKLTLNKKHDTASYSNHPHRESVNLINIFNVSSEDCLEVLVLNPTSSNPTFSLRKEITSPEVTHEIHDSEGCNFLSEELPDIDSFNDIHPHFDDNPLSGSTTYSSNSLLEECIDELALITYPPDYDDNLKFDIESDLREIEFLLYQGKDSSLKDPIDQTDLANLDDYFVDPTPEMFNDEHAPDYSFPSRFDVYDDDFLEIESDVDNFYDDPFDSKGEKIKESKLLIDELDLPCDFLPYSEYDSFASQDFSRDDALPSPNNEDKVFNPGILIQEKSIKIITRIAQEKKLTISYASLVFEVFDPPFYEPLVLKMSLIQ